MSKFPLDASMFESLSSLTHPVEMCGPDGRVVGKFYPKIDWSEWEPLDPNEPEVTEEELRRLAASNEPRYTTPEVIKYLESL
jgi:hypothetical protein